jgi:hypothetical protein
MARQLGVVSVYHGAALRKILRQEVAEPHPTEISSSLPRSVRMSIQSGNGNNAILCYLSVTIFYISIKAQLLTLQPLAYFHPARRAG